MPDYRVSYDVHFKDGSVNEMNHQSCFGRLINISNFKDEGEVVSITYYPEWERGGLTKEKVEKYYGLLLNELRLSEYLVGKPTVEEVLEDGLTVSSKASTASMLFIFTLFRYAHDYPYIVEAYLTLRELGGMTESKYLEWAHKVCDCRSLYGIDTEHCLTDGSFTTLCDRDIIDIFADNWKEDPSMMSKDSSRKWLSSLYRGTSKVQSTALYQISKSRKHGQSKLAMIGQMYMAIEELKSMENERLLKEQSAKRVKKGSMPGEWRPAKEFAGQDSELIPPPPPPLQAQQQAAGLAIGSLNAGNGYARGRLL